MPELALIIFVACLIVLLGMISSMIRIVPQFQRLVVFRLGVCIGERGPGMVMLYPFGIDRAVAVDLREEARETPHQTYPTKDNALVEIT